MPADHPLCVYVYLPPLAWTDEELQAGCRDLCCVPIHKWFVYFLQREEKNRGKYCLPLLLNLAVMGLCEAIGWCDATLGYVCACVCMCVVGRRAFGESFKSACLDVWTKLGPLHFFLCL